jgi:DNA-directed RNA polymerase subunit omega
MLSPSMNALKARVNNRYMLVNITARRARVIAAEAEEDEMLLDNKPVTIALHEIADGDVTVLRDTGDENAFSVGEVWNIAKDN